MKEMTCDTRRAISELAEEMIQRYVRGLLSVNWLVAQLTSLAGTVLSSEEGEYHRLEIRAQSLCSQALCEACLSADKSLCDKGFDNLGRYLKERLACIAYRASSQGSEASAEIVQQTLVEILSIIRRRGKGPDQPATFLKWAQTILYRQVWHYRQVWQTDWLSLEDQQISLLETVVDRAAPDPLEAVLEKELQEGVERAISLLKNPHHRQVLLKTLLAEVEVQELAEQWEVQVQDIYLWRYRALKTLRKDPQMLQALLRHV